MHTNDDYSSVYLYDHNAFVAREQARIQAVIREAAAQAKNLGLTRRQINAAIQTSFVRKK